MDTAAAGAKTPLWRRPIGWLAGSAIAAGLFTSVIAAMVADRALLLRSPTEIVLTPIPVDPRDLFRGDYVILSYAISERPPDARELASGEDGWALIARDDADRWRVIGLSRARPETAPPGAVALRVSRRGGALKYGLERFYVPEGEGRRLERLIGSDAITVAVAVDGRGRAAIKRLMVDGETAYEEPLF